MTGDTRAPVDGLVRLCQERAATYGVLRESSLTAIALDSAAAEITAARQRIAALEGALTDIFAHFSDDDDGAPGHCHDVSGVWDSDNAPGIAGKPCDWCTKWNRARATMGLPDDR